ncbi:MAG: hypothetical protein ACK5MZ_09690 [Aestuariibaculum sp.]
MKNLFLFTIVVLIAFTSCSPKITTLGKEESKKVDIGITAPSKAIFFVENETIFGSDAQIKNHTQKADKIHGQFGPFTDEMIAARTNAKTFTFSSGNKIWFINVNKLKNRTAMILFNGRDRPVVEYSIDKYQILVDKYFTVEMK